MIDSSDSGACVDVNTYLIAFCALAMELYPGEEWAAVEPKLERSWQRYLGDGMCHWSDVRNAAQKRWAVGSIAYASAAPA